LEGIDLSSWRIAGCGAEPIRPETLQAFADAFAGVGFRKEALLPSYGMAESSLAVSFTELEEGMKAISVDGAKLFGEGKAMLTDGDAVRLVSCGKEFPEHSIRIFKGDEQLPEDTVGEIRVKGPSVMTSYWDDDEQTQHAFANGWLKTGDLGFLHDAHLYVCGRTKEVIITNGRNFYPQDIEWEASRVEGVRKGNVVAFGTYYKPPDGEGAERERVVLVFETQASADAESVANMIRGVRESVQSGIGLMLDDVVAVAPGVLPKTSSGKLQRNMTRDIYERGELASWPSSRDVSKLEVVKQAALSQLSYFKLAVFKGKRSAPE
jgi:acyl-CoA synthetase (AMP-forming)/AMP-acid ligase II